jgi:quercetin dioxygenase-like cupin family protein
MTADRFEDHRGVIQDLLGPVDAVTEIASRAGAVRGNHLHKRTVQYTYVVRGRLLVVAAPEGGERTERYVEAGEMITEEAGIPHAWRALEATTVLVFTKGPRSGTAYESDVIRLEVPLLT